MKSFLGVGFRQRAAKHSEILRKYESFTAVDRAPTRHDAVSRHLGLFHAEIIRSVGDEHIEFFE